MTDRLFCSEPRYAALLICAAIMVTACSSDFAMAAGLPSACIKGAVVLTLLGGTSDSPIIPVSVNGHDAAMYASPGFGSNFVHPVGDLWYPSGPSQTMKAQDGINVHTVQTVLENVQLGSVVLPEISARILGGEAKHKVGNRPIIGLLGRNVLKAVDLMIDVPHRKLAIFKWDRSSCGNDPTAIFNGAYTSLHMSSDAEVEVSVHGNESLMQLDPDLEESVLPLSTAHDDGVTDEDLKHDPKIMTRYAANQIGSDHQFSDVRMSTYAMPSFNFLVQKSIDTPVIGGNFFAAVIALFDFPGGRFYFQPSDDRNDAPLLRLHFDQSWEGNSTVKERQGQIH